MLKNADDVDARFCGMRIWMCGTVRKTDPALCTRKMESPTDTPASPYVIVMAKES
jgi:hypothetical protein